MRDGTPHSRQPLGGGGATAAGAAQVGWWSAPCVRPTRAGGHLFVLLNGPGFAATAVRDWINGVGTKTAFFEPGSPWENGYVESFNGKLCDELRNMEVCNTLADATVLIEGWRGRYNTVRPHSSLRYQPAAPETVLTYCIPPPTGQNSSGSVQALPMPH
jgi:putative transposase